MREENDALLERRFNWDRFALQVVEAIESDESPALEKRGAARRTRLMLADAASRGASVAPGGVLRSAKDLVAGGLKRLTARPPDWARRDEG
jgi:hypothetical protein